MVDITWKDRTASPQLMEGTLTELKSGCTVANILGDCLCLFEAVAVKCDNRKVKETFKIKKDCILNISQPEIAEDAVPAPDAEDAAPAPVAEIPEVAADDESSSEESTTCNGGSGLARKIFPVGWWDGMCGSVSTSSKPVSQ